MMEFKDYVLITIKALKTISAIALLLLGSFLGLKCMAVVVTE